jgi:hypothetical protein
MESSNVLDGQVYCREMGVNRLKRPIMAGDVKLPGHKFQNYQPAMTCPFAGKLSRSTYGWYTIYFMIKGVFG